MHDLRNSVDQVFEQYENIHLKADSAIVESDRYSFADRILQSEFLDLGNSLTNVYKRVVLLNSLYSTNVYSTFPISLKISRIVDFQERVKLGDITLVEEIRRNSFKEKKKDLYSFATKYCHHHNPNGFPIYDSFVVAYLVALSKSHEIEKVDRPRLKDYKYFKSVIDDFAQRNQLGESYCYAKIDKFLWDQGKKMNMKKRRTLFST